MDSETTTGTMRRLTRSNEELATFAYGAAHDLKGPLRGIVRLAGFVMDDVGDTLPEQSQRHLRQIESRADYLTKLVDGLLQYATLEADQLPRAEVDVAAETQALWDLRDIEGYALELNCEVAHLAAPTAAVHRVLNNLLGNAVAHHDRPEGTVRVLTRRVGEVVELIVEDDGPGVAERYRARVMELFTTLQGGEGRGTGMGLALVRRTIEQLGGRVRLEAAEPRGLRVVVEWPTADGGAGP